MRPTRDPKIIFAKVEEVFGVTVPEDQRTPENTELYFRILVDQKKGQKRIRNLEKEREINDLTGLPNHIALDIELSSLIDGRQEKYEKFIDAFKKEHKRCPTKEEIPQQHPYTVIFADINYFKLFNNISHDGADGMIKAVASLLRSAVRTSNNPARPSDFLARSKKQGDEFVMVLPVELHIAEERIKQLSKFIQEKTFLMETPGKKKYYKISNLSVAFGCYQLDASSERLYDNDYRHVLAFAEEHMKDAKKKKDASLY